jgi:hypothetical protein
MMDDDDQDGRPPRARSCDLAAQRIPSDDYSSELTFEEPRLPPPTLPSVEPQSKAKESDESTPVLPAAHKNTVPDPKLSEATRSDFQDDDAKTTIPATGREIQTPRAPAGSRRRSVSEPAAADNNKAQKTMRKSGKHLEAKVCPLPPPSWHSEAADRQHRQAMILEMYVTRSLEFFRSLVSDVSLPYC